MIGDVVGRSGIAFLKKHIPELKKQYNPICTVVNGENSAANGRGISPKDADAYFDMGIDVITTGNHVWDKRDIYSYLGSSKNILRPANFPPGTPGKGMSVLECEGITVAVLNLQGRVFMKEQIDCPFRTAESAVSFLKSKTPIILVDMHAETTSEKRGMGFFLDGSVSAVVGTHTHVPTADNYVLPQGTAYISDLGMVGARNSMLGMKKGPIIDRFINQLPTRFEVETEGSFVLYGIALTIDSVTGKAQKTERISIIDTNVPEVE